MGTENSKGLYFWRWGREGGERAILMHNLSKVILPNVCVGLLPSSFGMIFFTGHIPPTGKKYRSLLYWWYITKKVSMP